MENTNTVSALCLTSEGYKPSGTRKVRLLGLYRDLLICTNGVLNVQLTIKRMAFFRGDNFPTFLSCSGCPLGKQLCEVVDIEPTVKWREETYLMSP